MLCDSADKYLSEHFWDERMIRIEPEPWAGHGGARPPAYPNECCGAMLGVDRRRREDRARAPAPGKRLRGRAGARATSCAPKTCCAADKAARERKLDLIGIYHSHPDCDAYFSKTDLKNSCPWYSFVVLSMQKGEFDHANSWLPNFEQTEAEKEELIY